MRVFHRLSVAAAAVLAITGIPYVVYGLGAWLTDATTVRADRGDWEPTVSVVVPTYNESAIIESKLENLVALDYPASKLEVIVVDASTDETPAIVEAFFADRAEPSLTLLHDENRRGVAAELNDAFAAASGEVVFRTDADSRLASEVVRHAVADLADPEIGAVTGRQTTVIGDSTVEGDYRGILYRIQAFESWIDSTFIVHGPCFAFRQEAVRSIPADTIADDTALGVLMRRTGHRVVVDPEMQFAEAGTSAFGDRRLRKDRRATGLVQQLARSRDMLGSYGLFGWVVLPFNWWFMVVSPWLLAVALVLATAAAGVVAGPFALGVPLGVAVAVWLGSRERLGPLQPLYAVVDAQVSLLVGTVRYLAGDASETWELDRESREAFRR